jgi:hypothetical protein
MADRGRRSDPELEAVLRDLGSHYPYPSTPNLSTPVRARLATSPLHQRQPGLGRRPLRLAFAAAILLVLVGGAVLLNPFSRDAVAHFFHVGGVVVTRSAAVPSVSSSPLNLGPATTLQQAQAAVSFIIVVPSKLGPPDAVYVIPGVPGGEVMLAYKAKPGIPLVPQTGLGVLITEFQGNVVPEFLSKELGPDSQLEETSVSGDPAWWISGHPHGLIVQVTPGQYHQEELRLAANTLVWQDEGVTLRIESGLSKSNAMNLASQMP